MPHSVVDPCPFSSSGFSARYKSRRTPLSPPSSTPTWPKEPPKPQEPSAPLAPQMVAIVCSSLLFKSVRPTCSSMNCFTMSRCTCSFRAVELLNEATVGSLSRRRLRQESWSCWRRRGERSVSATPFCANTKRRWRQVPVQGPRFATQHAIAPKHSIRKAGHSPSQASAFVASVPWSHLRTSSPPAPS